MTGKVTAAPIASQPSPRSPQALSVTQILLESVRPTDLQDEAAAKQVRTQGRKATYFLGLYLHFPAAAGKEMLCNQAHEATCSLSVAVAYIRIQFTDNAMHSEKLPTL